MGKIMRKKSGRRGLRPLVLAAVLLLLAGLWLVPAQVSQAQETSPPTADEIDRVVDLMNEDETRDALRALLLEKAAAPAEVAEGDLLQLYRTRLHALGAALLALPAELANSLEATWQQGLQSALGYALLLLLAGLAARWASLRGLGAAQRRARATAAAHPGAARLSLLLIDLIGIAAFAAGVAVALLVLPAGGLAADEVATHVLRGVAIILAVRAVSGALLAPDAPERGLLALPPGSAVRLHRIVVLTALGMVGVALLARLLFIQGVTFDAAVVLSLLASLAVMLLLLVAPWLWHRRVREAIVGAMGADTLVGRLALLWPLPLNLLILAIWAYALDNLIRGLAGAAFRTLLAVLLLLLIMGLARAISARTLRDLTGVGPSAAAAGSLREALTAGRQVVGAIWVTAFALAFFLLSALYQIDWAGFIGLGGATWAKALEVLLTALVAYVAYALLVSLIDRRLARVAAEGSPAEAKRLRTLLPLLRWFLLALILVVAVLTGLSAMGVDIGPLIAGAGVFGLAIGLGTQTLVTDVVAGIFFLIDDAFAVGDYIQVGDKQGEVESISIRSLKLRHHRGAVHTIPFGQMKALTNHSRDWVIVKLEFRVSPETDLMQVKKIVKKIAAELSAHPEYARDLLEPLKSQGVRRIEDNAMIVGVKFKAVPGTQFVIRREAFQRIRDAFHAAGIAFVDRGVVVHVSGAEGTVAEAAAGAAAQATAAKPAAAD